MQGRCATCRSPLPASCTERPRRFGHAPPRKIQAVHGQKKELPIGTTLSNKNQGQSGVQKSESKFLLTGGACNIDNFTIASIVRAKKILKKLS